MAEPHVERRLAAILAADVAGFTRLTGADEEGTLARLRALRLELIDPAIAAHRGRVVKRTGDGTLVEFASVVDALRCAIELQRAMVPRNAGLKPEERIEFRVGINLGDVVVESDGDLMGDGVNIAARLEGIAPPGGISMSDDAYRQVQGKVAAEFVDMGEQSLKNVARPVRVYRVATDAERSAATLPSRPAATERPSIAVLPFQNMSGDAEQEHFADGLAEDIITTLSKIRGLLVIARNSSFTYKGKAVDVRHVARELGVRYVREGSVRRSADRFRITAQLIDAASGNHVWAERYDRPVRDVFDVQDEITREIALALSVELTAGEIARVFNRSTRSLEAWLHAMRGFDAWVEGSPKGIREARGHFERAVAADPNYAMAWAFMAYSHWMEMRFGFSADPKASIAAATEFAEKAAAIDPAEPHAHGARAMVWSAQGRFEDAVKECETAVEGSPNDAWIRAGFARVLVHAGDAARGAQAIRDAMQLNPFHPSYYYGVLANALEELGDEDEAVAVLVTATRREPDYFAGHLRLASLHGRVEAANAERAEALRINPRFTLNGAAAFYGSANEAATERFKLGLRKAGWAD